MSFIVKQHKPDNNTLLLAIVDDYLLGKKIVEKNKILDLTSNFYKGDKKSTEEVLLLIQKANYLNAVGTNIINLLKKEEIIETTNKIGGTPYSQITLVKD